ncbi:murein hydrolase activator EnvC family protein [Parahaliea aestuarii]|uniref:Peptidoglycan DD-metalloendopeptidase family protein n=1 Tax=Parahaliea aestuarii TaxID=1852021 RepID=A0A5C8ZXE9_9GAMM|nr:peptidoglycan DD-metalloendopeptidase family protein [Parahaliea aestuarii]TXS92509.1 peptidoglycan DD-metalloendopeptidase family protein [Parahaliea aestuarii]
MRSRPAPLLLALLLAAPLSLAQSDEGETKARLQTLQKEIKQLDRELSSARTRRDTLLAELRKAETALGELQKQIAATRADITASERELAALAEQQTQLEQRRARQQKRIAEELETAWKMGRQDQLKVLLNQEDPHTLARAMAYYRYFFDARNAQIEAFRATLAELAGVRDSIEAERDELQARQQTLADEQVELEAQKGTRQEAADALAADISSKGDALAQLKKDQKELEALLQTIQQAVIDLALPDNTQPFGKARGKMPWPVAGKPSNRFGRARNDGKMTWQGVNIPAAAGAPVRAIHHGRVVYADWFRGSGLLLIVDHGDGYMSLYAHNQSLQREVGEWVQAGSVIGGVGDSGGLERPALYFEIRHNGKPVDPAGWCSG